MAVRADLCGAFFVEYFGRLRPLTFPPLSGLMLPTHRPRRHYGPLLLLVVLLLFGCRSERVAFGFQPVSVQKPIALAISHPKWGTVSVVPPKAEPVRSQWGATPVATSSSRPLRTQPGRAWLPPSFVENPVQGKSRQWTKHRSQSVFFPRETFANKEQEDTAQFADRQLSDKGFGIIVIITGILLITAGVLLGLLLGSWPGFGVALLLIALGCVIAFTGRFFLSYFVRHK